MKYFANKNTNSFTGAEFAPSSRSAVNSADIFFSDTAAAVSVLFSLILFKALTMLVGLIISLALVLIIMCTVNSTKQTASATEIAF